MTIATLIRMRKNGLTYREISDQTGIPVTTIATRCKTFGITPDVPILPKRTRSLIKYKHISKERLVELYWVDGNSFTEMQMILDIPAPSLKGLFDFYDIPRRSVGEARKLFVNKHGIEALYKFTEKDHLHGRAIRTKKERARKLKNEKRRKRSAKANAT